MKQKKVTSQETVKCKGCGIEFKRFVSQRKQVYCSKECRELNMKRISLTMMCNNCGKPFTVFPSKIRVHGCCSPSCKKIWLKKLIIAKHTHVCDNCGKEFVRNVQGRMFTFCSQDCSKTYMMMERSPAFKNGRTVDGNGYVSVSVGRKKRKYEHRMVMESHINRKLETNEVVHHKNGNKLDNRIENLVIMYKCAHDRHHTTERHKRERKFGKQKQERTLEK